MSTTQELIEKINAIDPRDTPIAAKDALDEAAARLASLSAKNAALKAKLAGVDEKALEAAARILAGAATPTEMEDSGFNAYHRIEYAEICWRDHADRARAAIAAYLAAVGGE